MEWNNIHLCFWDELVCCSQTPKTMCNILADSETSIKYKDCGALVSRWSNWNACVFCSFSHCTFQLKNKDLFCIVQWIKKMFFRTAKATPGLLKNGNSLTFSILMLVFYCMQFVYSVCVQKNGYHITLSILMPKICVQYLCWKE